MEESEQNNDQEDHFFDALDDFPFFDCIDTEQSEVSTSHSTISQEPNGPFKLQSSPESPSPTTLRRRRSLSQHNRQQVSSDDPKDPNQNSLASTEASRIHDKAKRYKFYRDLKANDRECEKSDSTSAAVGTVEGLSSVSEPNIENSTVSTANNDRLDDAGGVDEPPSNFLVFLAGLLIKAIGFQIKLLIRLFTSPILFFYRCYMFVIDPFGIKRRIKGYVMGKVLKLCGTVTPYMYEWLKEQTSIWKLTLQFGWGLLWAIYVCCILCGLLVSSFIFSGLVIRVMVEEPIQMKESLTFDYTKNSPVAFVPIISCPEVACGANCWEKFEVAKSVGSRVVPPNHKVQVTVLLTLPESDYNRNLGVFQVRVDLLSANGKSLASSSHPCMLQFKSPPIRLLLTFLKSVPLVAGYLSEAQTLKIRLRGFTEGDVPTSCLKVVVEQRAEFRPGGGIPEIYTASLVFESELPFLKRMMWYWKKTLFIWTSMMLFVTELMFALLCCRPIILPRVRARGGSAANSSNQNIQPVQSS